MDENDLPGGDVVPTGEQVTDPWAGYQGQPPAPPPVELPYGQSHELRLQRLTSGLGQVEQDKTLNGPTKADLIGQIMGELGPLQKRKQEAQAQQQQQQQSQLLNETAQAQAIKGLHQQSDAQNFLKGAATITDPDTGKTVHYVQTKPGEFEPVDFSNTGESDRPVDDAGPAPGEADRAIEPPTITAAPTADGTHRMTIWNGNRRQDYEYPSDGGQARMVYDSHPPEQPQAQQPPADGYLSDHERFIAKAKAEQQFAAMPPGPRKAERVAEAAKHYERITERENRDRVTRQRQVEEHQRQEAERERLAEQKKGNQEHADKWLANKNTHLKGMIQEWQAANADPSTGGNKHPALTDDVRTMLSEQANRMADQDHIDAYGEEHLPASRKAARTKDQAGKEQPPPANQPPAAAPPPKVEPLPPEKLTLEDALRIKAERERAKRPEPEPPDYSYGGMF